MRTRQQEQRGTRRRAFLVRSLPVVSFEKWMDEQCNPIAGVLNSTSAPILHMQAFSPTLVVLAQVLTTLLLAVTVVALRRRLRGTRKYHGRVLITGAAHGIGLELAKAFYSIGADLVLWDIDDAGLASASSGFSTNRILTSRVDVSDPQDVAGAAALALSHGPVDVVISNAGIVCGADVEALSATDVRRTLDINLGASFSLLRAFLPAMKARQQGCAVLVASMMGLLGGARLSAYCASKWGMFGLAESLRMELHRENSRGVHVVTVAPYLVGDTELFRGAFARIRSVVDVLRSALFPPLTASAVATATVEAVCSRRDVVLVLPWYASAAVWAVRALPLRAADTVVGALGGWHGMETFVGRASAQ